MSFSKQPLFDYRSDGTIGNGVTKYINLPVVKGFVGAYVAWVDATSSATVTVELTSLPGEEAPTATAGTYQWKDSGESFTGPAASAAGSLMINLENVRQSRARLKVVGAAVTSLIVYNGDHPQ